MSKLFLPPDCTLWLDAIVLTSISKLMICLDLELDTFGKVQLRMLRIVVVYVFVEFKAGKIFLHPFG